jgi:mRNA interferase MazF
MALPLGYALARPWRCPASWPAPSSSSSCIPLTSNLKWATAPGNARLPASATGLPKESVANVSRLVALDKTDLTERTGKLPRAKLELVLSGIDVVLGR